MDDVAKDTVPSELAELRGRVAELEANRQEEFYLTVFRGNHAIMLLVDPETGDILYTSLSACFFYGYPHAELMSMRIHDISEVPDDEVDRRLASAMVDEQAGYDTRHRLAGGEVKDVEAHTAPVVIRNGILPYVLIHDISERVQSQNEIREHQEHVKNLYPGYVARGWACCPGTSGARVPEYPRPCHSSRVAADRDRRPLPSPARFCTIWRSQRPV